MNSSVQKIVGRRLGVKKPDRMASEAVDLARQALLEVAEAHQVGEHLGTEASGERLVTHKFQANLPGYDGWYWISILTRVPRSKHITVCETALVPGDQALLAPAWEPWAERLRPGDLGSDDVLPYRKFDERLEAGFESTGEDADAALNWELGLGRARVLSQQGRSEAATRWIDGEFGPKEISRRRRRGTVQAQCGSCGFLTLLSGSLRQEFGVCTNEWSAADGKVVSLRYGCGAHSETEADISSSSGKLPPKVLDEEAVDFEDRFAERSIIDEDLLQEMIESKAEQEPASAEEPQTDSSVS